MVILGSLEYWACELARSLEILEHSGAVLEVHLEALEGDGYLLDEGNDYYSIGINKSLSEDEQIETLSHEMIHLKQMLEGRLTFHSDTVAFWEGKAYPIAGPSSWDYWLSPWELEANSLQRAHVYMIKLQSQKRD